MNILQQHGILQQTRKKSIRLDDPLHSVEINTFPINSIFDGASPFSISLWVKLDNVSSPPGRSIFSNITASSGNAGYALELESASELRFWGIENFNFNDYFLGAFTGLTLSNNTWYHIVVTYDGGGSGSLAAGGLNIYVDGSALTLSNIIQDSIDTPVTGFDTLDIGNGSFFGGNCPGNYDEFTIWDIELSSSQVSALYNSGTPGNPRVQVNNTNLQIWLRFDEDDIFYSTARDSQGTADGIINNAPASNIEEDTP